MTKERKPRKPTEKQLLVSALLKDYSKKCNWALEMRMLKQILLRIPDVKFWFHFAETHRYASLLHLLSDIQKTNRVSEDYNMYTLDSFLKGERTQIPITVEKPKTFKEFIKNV